MYIHVDVLPTGTQAWLLSHGVLPISYFASGKDQQLFLFSLILWPSYPGVPSPLRGGARADIRCRTAESLREQGSPSCWVSPLLCNTFPIIETILRLCFQLCPCCQINDQLPAYLTQSLPQYLTQLFTLSTLTCFFPWPLEDNSVLPVFLPAYCLSSFTFSLLSKCCRTKALTHLLSLGSFPFLSVLFPCVYSPFSIIATQPGLVMTLAWQWEP